MIRLPIHSHKLQIYSIIGSTYTLTAYTDYDLDGFRHNDTLQKSITNNPLEYCTSTATTILEMKIYVDLC